MAGKIAVDFPTVRQDSSALEAARLLAEQRLPGLIVVDDRNRPRAVLPGSQLLRFMIPRYVQVDPTLAHVYDESQADQLCGRLADKRVEELLPAAEMERPVVDAKATVMEIAMVMAKCRSPVVAVVADIRDDTPMMGAITVAQLLNHLLPAP